MAHHNANEQPGLEVHEQAGLEVVSEPEAPHVVNGPTIFGKPVDQTPQNHQNYTQYGAGAAATSPYHEYPQYPQSPPYANSPLHPPQSQWAPSQVGTMGPSASEKGAPEPTILGIKRKKFWLIFGPLLAVLVIGLAVGLGVGLGTSHSTSTSTAASSSTATATSSTATATATVSAITCPSSNGSYYLTSDDTKFLVLCNLDYNQGGGTEDISNPVTNTVEDCATTCANNGTCAGAGWGEYYGTTYCWMKSYLGTSQTAPNWYFLIKQ